MKKLKLSLKNGVFSINEIALTFPFEIKKLISIIGKHDRKEKGNENYTNYTGINLEFGLQQKMS